MFFFRQVLLHASLAASMSARGFLCMRILLPHPTYTHIPCDAFSLWVAWAWRGLPDVRYACKRASQRLQHASLRTFHTWRWSRRWWRIPTPRGRPHGRNESCFCECIYVLRDGRMVGERVKKYLARKDGARILGWPVAQDYIHDPSKL
jgi:hypothetical protein